MAEFVVGLRRILLDATVNIYHISEMFELKQEKNIDVIDRYGCEGTKKRWALCELSCVFECEPVTWSLRLVECCGCLRLG